MTCSPSIVCEGKNEIQREWPQVLAIFIGALTAFTDGAIFGWTSPFIVKLVEDKDRYDISEIEASYIPTILPISLIISCIFASNLSNIYGRKNMLLFIAVPQVICLVISALARSIYVFYISRIFSGMSSALMWTVLPMYVGEVASPQVRGTWGNAISVGFYSGVFAINVIGGYCQVDTTSYILLPFPIIFFIVFLFLPESPYYFIIKENYEGAKKSLTFLYRTKYIDNIFEEIKHAAERQMSESGTWKDLITIESNRKALYAGVFLRVSQQLGGLTVFNQYTQYIFQKAGGDVSPHDASMIISGTIVLLNIVSVILIIDRYSRKTLYAVSLVICSITPLMLSIYFYFVEKTSTDMSSLSWLPITTLLLYYIASSFGLSIIPTLLSAELFSASVKTKGISVLTVVMAVGVFAMSSLFTSLNYLLGSYAPFLFIAISTAICAILSLFLIPDTKGKTLEEIQMNFKGKA